jgi:hypothetical protein
MRYLAALATIGLIAGVLSSSVSSANEPSRFAKYSPTGMKARLELMRLKQNPQVAKAYRKAYILDKRSFAGKGMNLIGHGAMAAAQLPTIPRILDLAATRPGLATTAAIIDLALWAGVHRIVNTDSRQKAATAATIEAIRLGLPGARETQQRLFETGLAK